MLCENKNYPLELLRLCFHDNHNNALSLLYLHKTCVSIFSIIRPHQYMCEKQNRIETMYWWCYCRVWPLWPLSYVPTHSDLWPSLSLSVNWNMLTSTDSTGLCTFRVGNRGWWETPLRRAFIYLPLKPLVTRRVTATSAKNFISDPKGKETLHNLVFSNKLCCYFGSNFKIYYRNI